MHRTVSIVICTHNGQNYLAAQLQSLACQTLPAHEIIISDDDSTDGTRQIIENFCQNIEIPTKFIKNTPALGFSDNFMSACRAASGDWIALCDQDDIWKPNKLEVCSQYFDDANVTHIAHSAELINELDENIGRFDQGISETRRLPAFSYDLWGTFWGFSMIFRRDILQFCAWEERYVDYIEQGGGLIAHDRWVHFMGQVLGETVEICEDLVLYRQHGANLYGVAKERAVSISSHDLRSRNPGYIASTKGMLKAVAAIPDLAVINFPSFSKNRSLQVLQDSLSQLEAREAVFRNGGAYGMAIVMKNLLKRRYHNPRTGVLRWQSVARDGMFCLTSMFGAAQ
jgi:glycosyltransferase involved in cell wall biosynthesis